MADGGSIPSARYPSTSRSTDRCVNLYDAARDAYGDASDMVFVGSDGFLSVENPGKAAIFQALANSIIAKLDA